MKRHPILYIGVVFFLSVTSVFAADDSSTPASKKIRSPNVFYVKPQLQHDSFGEMKVLAVLTSDVPAERILKFHNLMNTAKAVEQWGGRMNAKFILYANGVHWLQKPNAEEKELIDGLRVKGVQFLVCDNTLLSKDIDYHSLYGVTEKDIVPSGFAEVAYLQQFKQYVVGPGM